GDLGIPEAIHVSDPAAFFLPADRYNERYEELETHPDWSFYDRDFPSQIDMLEALNRVLDRHPRAHFLRRHIAGDAADLARVSATGARSLWAGIAPATPGLCAG